MLERRHENDKAPGQCNVRGDAGALLAEGLLRDLNDDLLPFAEEIGDRRQWRLLTAAYPPGFLLRGDERLAGLLAARFRS